MNSPAIVMGIENEYGIYSKSNYILKEEGLPVELILERVERTANWLANLAGQRAVIGQFAPFGKLRFQLLSL
ncbi:MAG: hypothetical protein AABZ92_07620, partial [Verrucomicrobiota bacterium]